MVHVGGKGVAKEPHQKTNAEALAAGASACSAYVAYLSSLHK